MTADLERGPDGGRTQALSGEGASRCCQHTEGFVVVGHARQRPCPPERRSTATPRRTSRSSVPATRGFGPRTTCRASTRACGSWCSRARSPGSARPAATAAGARRSSRPRTAASRKSTGCRRPARCTRRCAPRSTRWAKRRPRSASTATSPRAGRCPWRGAKRNSQRASDELAAARDLGLGRDDLRLIGADEARRELGVTGVLGALVNPHCAAIHPARLVRGLADSVEKAVGEAVRIHPRSGHLSLTGCSTAPEAPFAQTSS